MEEMFGPDGDFNTPKQLQLVRKNSTIGRGILKNQSHEFLFDHIYELWFFLLFGLRV